MEGKITYPKISAKAIAALRKRLVAAPTTRFTPESVAVLVGLASPRSASNNYVRPMQQLGLLDEDGVLTERGRKWRVDLSYGDACQEILDEIYPDDLGALVDDDGAPDSGMVRNWFDNKGFGGSNAGQMTNTYVMIANKQLPELPATDSDKAKKHNPTSKKSATKPSKRPKKNKQDEILASAAATPPVSSNGGPTVHLDIQIHIPADATPEQIDQIFSSMSRHLYAK